MSELRYLSAVPDGVRVYSDTHSFIAEDPGRQSRWQIPGDIGGGWDVADGFRLAETEIPGEFESEWRICVVDRMVCAVLRRYPGQPLYTFDGPVWVLADVPAAISAGVDGPAIRSLLWQVERMKGEPDSLLGATQLIRICFAVLEAAAEEKGRNSAAVGSDG